MCFFKSYLVAFSRTYYCASFTCSGYTFRNIFHGLIDRKSGYICPCLIGNFIGITSVSIRDIVDPIKVSTSSHIEITPENFSGCVISPFIRHFYCNTVPGIRQNASRAVIFYRIFNRCPTDRRKLLRICIDRPCDQATLSDLTCTFR